MMRKKEEAVFFNTKNVDSVERNFLLRRSCQWRPCDCATELKLAFSFPAAL